MDSPPPTRLRLPRAARRAQIVQAAAGAFLDAGFDRTSMDGVARAAGVTRLVVYRVFETKERLYRAVLSAVTDDLTAEVVGKNIEDLRREGGIVKVMLGVARRHPDAFRLLWRQAAGEPLFADFSRRFREELTRFAREVITPDERISDPLLQTWCASALGSHLLDGLCSWLDTGDPADDQSYIVLQTCGLLALLEAWADPHPPEWIRG
jgi:AcrR family transcriptional regulator